MGRAEVVCATCSPRAFGAVATAGAESGADTWQHVLGPGAITGWSPEPQHACVGGIHRHWTAAIAGEASSISVSSAATTLDHIRNMKP